MHIGAAMMFALQTEVQVAIVTGTAAVVVGITAAVPAVLNRKTAKRIGDTIGKPNGHGSMMDMMGEILDKLDGLTSDTVSNRRRIDRLETIHLSEGGKTSERNKP